MKALDCDFAEWGGSIEAYKEKRARPTRLRDLEIS